jgi:hypothetical protein
MLAHTTPRLPWGPWFRGPTVPVGRVGPVLVCQRASYNGSRRGGGGARCCPVGRGRFLVLGTACGRGRISAQSCVLWVRVPVWCEDLTARREGLPAPLSFCTRRSECGIVSGIRSLGDAPHRPLLSLESSWDPGLLLGEKSREHPSSTGTVSVLSRAKARKEKDRGTSAAMDAGLTTTTALRRAGATDVRRTGAEVGCALPEQERTHMGQGGSLSLCASVSLPGAIEENTTCTVGRPPRTNIAPVLSRRPFEENGGGACDGPSLHRSSTSPSRSDDSAVPTVPRTVAPLASRIPTTPQLSTSPLLTCARRSFPPQCDIVR